MKRCKATLIEATRSDASVRIESPDGHTFVYEFKVCAGEIIGTAASRNGERMDRYATAIGYRTARRVAVRAMTLWRPQSKAARPSSREESRAACASVVPCCYRRSLSKHRLHQAGPSAFELAEPRR